MEIRARYVQMGAFTLAVMVGWVLASSTGSTTPGGCASAPSTGSRSRARSRDCCRGSAVLFNGIRVGEVTALELDPPDPRQVMATIAIERSAPVRADTQVAIDFQGLTGSPVIALAGGSSMIPLCRR